MLTWRHFAVVGCTPQTAPMTLLHVTLRPAPRNSRRGRAPGVLRHPRRPDRVAHGGQAGWDRRSPFVTHVEGSHVRHTSRPRSRSCTRYGRHAHGMKPQCAANRRNSAFITSSPPPDRSSDSTTARIWSNSSSAGTPPNRANARMRSPALRSAPPLSAVGRNSATAVSSGPAPRGAHIAGPTAA